MKEHGDSGSYVIKTMDRTMMLEAMSMAKEEGWNPGLFDSSSYLSLDSKGFFSICNEGGGVSRIIGVISVVLYFLKGVPRFAYLGLFIVKKSYRRRGHGQRLWSYAINDLNQRAPGVPVFLDAVRPQIKRYQSLGFVSRMNNYRFTKEKGEEFSSSVKSRLLLRNSEEESRIIGDVIDYDSILWGASRSAFIKESLRHKGSRLVVFRSVRSGMKRVLGYALVRRCVVGYRVGPFYSDSMSIAREILRVVLSGIPNGSNAIMDCPDKSQYIPKLPKEFGFSRDPGIDTMEMSNNGFCKERDEGLRTCISKSSLEIG